MGKDCMCGIPQAWYGAGLLSLWSKGRVGSIPTSRAISSKIVLVKTVLLAVLFDEFCHVYDFKVAAAAGTDVLDFRRFCADL
jgi:hypothetical protein